MMRVGLVCPYSFDAPGGVQLHVRDLAEELQRRGHVVSVLAPAEEGTDVPDYVVPAGRAMAVPYNGSVARLSFGPVSAGRVRRWLDHGAFDVVHVHEPETPSLGLLATWMASQPVVGTFHTAMDLSRFLLVASPLEEPILARLSARIAVSAEARRTLVQHLGGDAVVVPNGVYVDRFRVPPDPRWEGTAERPTVAFLGRLDEPRKGLPVLAAAIPQVLDRVPGARFLVAGGGDAQEERAALAVHGPAVTFLGRLSEPDKAALLASVDAYVAPQTGGESFGIVLVEAMSAGAAVVASDLPAFRAVLDNGETGRLFRTGDPGDLARILTAVLTDRASTAAVRAQAAQRVRRYDWSTVAQQILAVYETVVATAANAADTDPPGGMLRRLGGRPR